jgi:hypothetical protein
MFVLLFPVIFIYDTLILSAQTASQEIANLFHTLRKHEPQQKVMCVNSTFRKVRGISVRQSFIELCEVPEHM